MALSIKKVYETLLLGSNGYLNDTEAEHRWAQGSNVLAYKTIIAVVSFILSFLVFVILPMILVEEQDGLAMLKPLGGGFAVLSSYCVYFRIKLALVRRFSEK